MGRPTKFKQKIADAICERIADGESLRRICATADMPDKATVFRWLAAMPAFCDQYARAREAQADSLTDDILPIMDERPTNMVQVMHKRDRVEARKWLASKLRPKTYGDKLDLNHGGEVAVAVTDARDELAERLAKLAAAQPSGS